MIIPLLSSSHLTAKGSWRCWVYDYFRRPLSGLWLICMSFS